jgi:3'-phosphoadenosine 5'-phosphosulfate (PAPS) 3'-phosphatase
MHLTPTINSVNSCTNLNNNNNNTTRVKLDGTIVTDADGAAQRIICTILKQVSPNVRIVGEETNEEVRDGFESATKRNWIGVSPISKRKALDEEKEEDDRIHDLIRQEVLRRFRQHHIVSSDSSFTGLNASALSNELDNQKDSGMTQHHQYAKINLGTDDEYSDVIIDAHRVSVFVDPLDGTGCYAKGEFEFVTTLIGIIVDNTPVFGVIGKPFGHEGMGNFDNTDCCIVYGGTLINGAFTLGGDELRRSQLFRYSQQNLHREKNILHQHTSNTINLSQEQFNNSNDDDTNHLEDLTRRKAIISQSRSGGVVQKCIECLADRGLLHQEPIHIAGAGYKTIRLILGINDETLWFFPKPGTALWDTAAADALLKVMGGRVTDKFGNHLNYSKSWKEADNLDGIIICSDASLHELCVELYKNEKWDDA